MKPNFKNQTLISLREDAHLRQALGIIYIYALITHVIFLFAFRFFGASKMELVNYFSPFIYLLSFLVNRKGRIALGASLAIGEAVVHGIISLVYVGWNANFHLYIVLVYLLIFFLYRIKMVVRIVLAVLITVAYAFLYIFSLHNLPVYTFPSAFIGITGIINLVNTVTVLSLFAINYSHFIRKNIKLLEEAEKQQRILNAQKNKFFSIFSHDLKNPISSIKSLLDLLIKRYNKLDDEKKLKHLNQIHHAIGDTYNLVNDLLEWSRSQLNNVKIIPENILVEKVIHDIVSLFDHHAASKDIVLDISIGDTLKVYVDMHCFYSIMRNIVSNAIKFTPIGGKVIIDAKSENGGTIIRVSDNGIGMSEKQLKHIYSIEKQEASVGTANERGTGLGLIVVKEFVEKNNGSINIESQVGKGSTFTLIFPSKQTLNQIQ